MKRSPGTQPLVPPALLERARNAAPPAALRTETAPANQNPFRIVNKGDQTADVYIYAEIGENWWGEGVGANSFLEEVKDLDVSEIRLHINSPGGDVFDGVTIYNTLVNHKARVVVYVDGLAASAASFIAQAGEEIVMGRGSMMMIHDASGMAWGNSEDMRKTGEVLDKISDTIAGFYAHRAGGTPEEWRGIMKEEAWYGPEEAVAAGLADRVGSYDSVDDKIEDRWNLSVFNYAGRQNSPAPDEIRRTVLNRISKEKNVGVKNEVDPQETEAEQPVVADTPDTTGVEPAEVAAPLVQEEEVAEDAEQVPPTNPTPADRIENKIENKAGVLAVVINGVRTTDPTKIQAHIDTLEGFANEAKKSGRQSFVDQLANDGKILASQKDLFTNQALRMDDEQYSEFVASWNEAPGLPLLGKHGVQDTTSGGGARAAKEQRLEVVRAIVAHHKAGNMKPEQLERTDSYVEMQNLIKELGLDG